MLRLSFYLAWRDYWHEWLLSLCAILGLVAVLAPLLVLGGVRFGIIEGLQQRLMDDPRNLELIPAGSGHYTQEWFERVRAYNGVGFLLPQTRSIAANIDMYQPASGQKETVELIATASQDPLLKRWGIAAPVMDELEAEVPVPVVLSATAARRLGVQAGAALEGRVGRLLDGARENATQPLLVAAVLPLEAQQKQAAYVPLGFLVALEDYRDGRAVPSLNWPGAEKPTGKQAFASFRLYAENLEAVEPLSLKLAQDFNLQITTRAEEISMVKNLDSSFALVFWLISGAAVFGFGAAVASQSLAAVKRKSRSLAILRLMGFSRAFILFMPMWQTCFTGAWGFALSCGFYWLVAGAINSLFANVLTNGQQICRLLPWHFLLAGLATLLLCALACLWAAFSAAKIDPAEVIRDV